MSRGRGSHQQEDLTGYKVRITSARRSGAQMRKQPVHYLCWYKITAPYVSMERPLSLRADDELQAYIKARQVLEKRGAEVVT